MTWKELAEHQKVAAEHLFATRDARFERAVCGRAYYAAYSLVTSRLSRSSVFGRGWKNPEHGKLVEHVEQIAGIHTNQRRMIKQALRRLRRTREDADYRPGVTVDRGMARASMRDLAEVFLILTRSE